MGLYVNPRSGNKSEWITANATSITPTEALLHDYKTDRLPVAYMENNPTMFVFDAIAIGYNKVETRRLLHGRPDAVWYTVPRTALKEWLP